MSEIKINFDKWDDAIDDISNHILDIYDKRIDFLSDVQNSISGLPGDYGYKWPAHGDVGNSKNDVENKKNDLIRFRDTLRNTYDYVKNEEENLAQRLYSDSNSFMHANGIQPEYEKSAFQKLCEGIANGVKDIGSVIADAVVWLWDSGIIQLVGEILIAAAAVVMFVACFPVSGFFGVLTAIGLGWGAAKAIADVVADTTSVVKYACGDKEGAEEWADYDMRSFFEMGAEKLNDITGLECFDEIGDVLYIALDTAEMFSAASEFGGNWKLNMYGHTNLNSFGTKAADVLEMGGDFAHESNRLTKFLTGGKELLDYNSLKNLKKVGKTIADFPDKGFASFTNLLNDKGVSQTFKNVDKIINYAGDPLSITLDGLQEHGIITGDFNKSTMNAYKDVKIVKDFAKNIYTCNTASTAANGSTIFGGSNINLGFMRETSLGYAPTLGTPIMISGFGGLSGINGGGTTTLMDQIVDLIR